MHKLWNILSITNMNIGPGKVRKQAAEYRSSPGYNLGSLSIISRSYWEPWGWMTNLFFNFHAFLDASKLLLMVAPVAVLRLLEGISTILVPTTYNLIPRVACPHSKEQRGLQGCMDKESKNKPFLYTEERVP